jgi:hypothetical protein
MWVPVAFDGEAWDTDDIHDARADATRLTARTAGLYVITASFEWESNPVGWRTAVLKINDVVNAAFDQRLAVNGAETVHAIAAQYLLAVEDYVQLVVHQNAGGPLRVGGGDDLQTSLSMSWVGG